MKIVVTHISPDLDSITSCWLIKRYLPGWKDSELKFVPAGSTLNNNPPDDNPDIMHVDTGLGKFDHHQTDEHTCAAKRVFAYLLEGVNIKTKLIPVLERMVDFVNEIDHFGEVYFSDATADRYDFSLFQIIEGLKSVINDDLKLIESVFPLLDAILQIFRNKVAAEAEIKKGLIFNSGFYGKCLALESKNEEATKLAMKMGFKLVVRRDPERGFVRIKTTPDKKLDLTSVYQEIKKIDDKGTWFLHVSKNMLLNSSAKNPTFKPTHLTLPKLIEIIKGIE